MKLLTHDICEGIFGIGKTDSSLGTVYKGGCINRWVLAL